MRRIPRSREVEQSIVAVVRELKAAGKELSGEATSMLARGKYDIASAMVDKCRLLGEFQGRILALRKEWRTLRSIGSGGATEKLQTTPVWKFYQHIALALVHLDGQSKRKELERELQSVLDAQLLPGDLGTTGRGVPRWQIMIRRARRPMIKEGFIEYGKGGWWRLTEAGRKLAEKPSVTKG